MTNKKINLSIIIGCSVVAVAILVFLFLPLSCPKGVDVHKVKSNSVDTVIVTDSSGSMDDVTNAGDGTNTTKYQAAKAAALEIVSMIEQENKSFGIGNMLGYVEFDGYVSKTFDLAKPTSELKQYLKSDNSRFAWGTNLGDGVDKAYDILKNSKSSNKIMIVLSDGRSNMGLTNEQVLSTLMPKLKEKGIKAYTVGFDANTDKMTSDAERVDPVFLYQIAKKTGGQYYYANKSLDLAYAFSDLYQQATGSVIASINGSIKEGQEKVAKVVVPCDCGNMRITLNNTPGSHLSVKFLTPSGSILTGTNGRLQTNIDGGFTNISYRDPQPGDWLIQIRGDSVKGDATDFYLSASVSSVGGDAGDWISDRIWFVVALIALIFVALCSLCNLLTLAKPSLSSPANTEIV